jgi:UDP-glucose 4-epimerase
MASMKILVTGSSGTIGTRLCEQLLEKGHDVVGLDSKPNEWRQAVDKITVKADLLKPNAFDDIPEGIGMVIHLAAYPFVYQSVQNPQLAMDNMAMTFNALEYARKNGIKRFMFGSSREVYGNPEETVRKEDDARIEGTESPYAAMKLAGEAMVRAYQQCYGIDFVIIRFSNVYGMYDKSDRLMPKSIRRARAGETLEVYGRDKLLDFTFIDDSVSGVVAAIEKFDDNGIRNETYNLAIGKPSTILHVVELINKSFGDKSKISVTNARPGEVIKYTANISKARERLGYNPKVGIEEGVSRAIKWYKKHLPA